MSRRRRYRRKRFSTGGFAKLALLVSLLALGFALWPEFQRENMSTAEKFSQGVKESVGRIERHALNDSKFQLNMEGDAKWHTLAMVCAIIGCVLGLVSLSTDLFVGGLAMVLGLAVGAWQFFAG